ncbi:MAG: glycosyltransferase family 4 protein [Deltaproteobacteria bacterium]|uniref:Glycosyltransferase family 4 protein n=1 Tax=Candidatus Desulfacyla euxinica TaxID=2841693 RepID=A0A8J6MXH7_9DELT|nr:glycosyltransferase family 4 protein [Candidatus Desulfacyla euxinica]
MRIGVDARPLSYQLTGIGVYLKHLLDEIQKIDHQNDYYLISNGPINYDLNNPRWSKIAGRLNRKLLSTLWMQINVPIIASKMNFDLFWGSRHHLPLLLSPGIKTVVTVHDVVNRLYPGTMALPNLFVERLLMKLSLKRSDAIIADSRSTAADIEGQFGLSAKKIDTIHLGTPIFPKEPECGTGQINDLPAKYFLFVGTLDPRKNFERIFKAFELLKPLSRRLHLVIVGGEGWKNRDFLGMVAKHPLKAQIRMPGYLPRNQLVAYYRNAICLMFPSLYEGFGFPILEAMSCGTPVITSNVSSMKEVAGSAALLVNPYDTGAISDAMNRLLGDEPLRRGLIKKGFKRAAEFSWKKCADETLKIINAV